MRLFERAVFSAFLLSVAVAAGCSSDSTGSNQQYTGPGGGKTGTQAGRTGTTAGTGTGQAGTSTTAGASGSGGKNVVAVAGMSGSAAGTTAGASGTSSTAGNGGASVVAGTGGHSGNMSDLDSGMASDVDAGEECIPPEKPLSYGGVPMCPKDVCPAQDSLCLPIEGISRFVSKSTLDILSKCDDTHACVPISIATQGGKGILPSCTSVNGGEGRCVSPCVPMVAAQASILPKDTCTGTDLCAPCYDPRTGEDTLACRQGCDSGPKEPPKPFDKCCSDRGLCVPPALAGSQAKNLNKEACTGENLCAPIELTDQTFKPKACESIDNAEGRCISTCVGGALGKQKDRLPKATCGTDEICAPCYDPVTGEDTGACSINGDMPTKPKYQFQACCGTNVGVCVPPTLAGDQADILRQESCASGKLCAPIKKAIDPTYKFPTCTSLLGKGACVSSCILDPTQAAILQQASCARGELCAPCELLGTPTKACD